MAVSFHKTKLVTRSERPRCTPSCRQVVTFLETRIATDVAASLGRLSLKTGGLCSGSPGGPPAFPSFYEQSLPQGDDQDGKIQVGIINKQPYGQIGLHGAENPPTEPEITQASRKTQQASQL
jgi:hypothetical protein